MARPPGKKKQHHYLLSGAGKALTLSRLVFSISSQPVSLLQLDEVDAPLDDANVGRYARIVKEMSKRVQFITFTHNKIAMENGRSITRR